MPQRISDGLFAATRSSSMGDPPGGEHQQTTSGEGNSESARRERLDSIRTGLQRLITGWGRHTKRDGVVAFTGIDFDVFGVEPVNDLHDMIVWRDDCSIT